MTAFNIVRFRVKPGHQEQFIAQHRSMNPDLKGFRSGSLVRTGENTFCFIGEWTSFHAGDSDSPEGCRIPPWSRSGPFAASIARSGER
jgi:quinol monooxygenase YgiN